MRCLVIEDEAALRHSLTERLRAGGFAVDAAADGEEGLYLGMEFPVDVGIVDLRLPGLSGIEVIRRLRAAGRSFPILILTARERWQDKVEGLNAGADDYVTKPFHMEEVLARVQALMRRSAGWAQPLLQCGPVSLDTSGARVSVHEEPVSLTSFEYRVLEYLMLHAGRVVSKTELTEHIYEDDADRDSNVIEVFIRRLRRKLDPEDRLKPIETLRGRGYRFTLPPRTD
ncbi:MAG: response regulator transcription factor [Gammaproteobacteria bacterium]|nr:response regulator transcription factor [Gammaproteobacteria bacterium]NIR84582.1 response regulator transcription factor [Gammaproteobacteria bacterium]NIR90485.1 response regulator transcription factor [Gammaproteobacteria bacterium]NIU05633.1 response regulator transcription factor [Gammaproteobacteria bacterium]NIV52772.1 response regulator [Gammaproteobacteria bacterium]